MFAIRSGMRRTAVMAICVIGLLAACQEDQPAAPAPPKLPVIQPDIESTLKGVPEAKHAAVRECLDALQKLMQEIISRQKWDLSGKTIVVRFDNMGSETGGETLPGTGADTVLIKISSAFCEWPESLRRMVVAHELDHARVIDDPAHGDGKKTTRQLRSELEAADRALRSLPPGTATDVRLKLLREELHAEIAQLEAKIREEERAYTAADTYGPGLGVSEDDLKNNRAQKEQALDKLRRELE